ncbi:MAG: Homoserine kinase, partial [uncultured Gemmatimonadaceae bacterium]
GRGRSPGSTRRRTRTSPRWGSPPRARRAAARAPRASPSPSTPRSRWRAASARRRRRSWRAPRSRTTCSPWASGRPSWPTCARGSRGTPTTWRPRCSAARCSACPPRARAAGRPTCTPTSRCTRRSPSPSRCPTSTSRRAPRARSCRPRSRTATRWPRRPRAPRSCRGSPPATGRCSPTRSTTCCTCPTGGRSCAASTRWPPGRPAPAPSAPRSAGPGRHSSRWRRVCGSWAWPRRWSAPGATPASRRGRSCSAARPRPACSTD